MTKAEFHSQIVRAAYDFTRTLRVIQSEGGEEALREFGNDCLERSDQLDGEDADRLYGLGKVIRAAATEEVRREDSARRGGGVLNIPTTDMGREVLRLAWSYETGSEAARIFRAARTVAARHETMPGALLGVVEQLQEKAPA